MTGGRSLDPLVQRLMGLETEYGIAVDGCGAEALMDESRELVRSYPHRWAGPWDYSMEDPRRDLRGFRVDRLNFDREDARFDAAPGAAQLSNQEQRSDRALTNGARLYNDHGHPEYATPECRGLWDLVAHDLAGELIVTECAQLRSSASGRNIRIYKNNTDFHGVSYGCHESYLTRRELSFGDLFGCLMPFLVTRSLLIGAGKVGVETEGPFRDSPFQLSQRADFLAEEASVDTLAHRPIFNTRDEPHVDPRKYLRLHVICGDANRSQWATAIKCGTLSLTLCLAEVGIQPTFQVRDPVATFRRLSRDPDCRWLVTFEDGRTWTAQEVQRFYQLEARRLLGGSHPDVDWVIHEWGKALDDLEADWTRCTDRIDWAAKRGLFQQFLDAEGLDWNDPCLPSLDLQYHLLDAEESLFSSLEAVGSVVSLVNDPQVETARHHPPSDTRARLRGDLVHTQADRIRTISWGRALLNSGDGIVAEEWDPEWGQA